MNEAYLPGIGTKFWLNLAEGEKLTVIRHNTGRYELYFFKQGEEFPSESLTMTENEARDVGSVLFGALGAVAFWFPKMTGKYLDERMGRVAFWLVFAGVQVTFISMFISGLMGMQRRVSSYAHAMATTNFISTIGAFVIMAGMIIETYTIVTSWRSGREAGRNPWRSKTLEWQVPTPVPLENFEVPPVVTSDPYGYGEAAPPLEAPAGHPDATPVTVGAAAKEELQS